MSELSDNELFFAYVTEYLDGMLTEEKRIRFHALLQRPEFQDMLESFKDQRGLLQVHMQDIHLSEDERKDLRIKMLSEDDDIAIQEQEIQNFEHSEGSIAQIKRWVYAIIGTVFACATIAYYVYEPEIGFNAVQSLAFEAALMESDEQKTRLSLPANTPVEIVHFFENARFLEFQPSVFSFPGKWIPEGASIIDYDIAKIAVTQYRSPDDDKLFHFSFRGRWQQLPKTTPGQLDDVTFYPYASESFNLIVWQSSENTLDMLVGRDSVPMLAKYAAAPKLSVKKDS